MFLGQNLGLDKYEKTRESIKHVGIDKKSVAYKMKKSQLNPKYDMGRFEVDLKSFLYLMSATSNDFIVLKTNLYKLVEKRSEYKGCNMIVGDIGAMIMRACYHLKMSDEALEVIDAQQLKHIEQN